jgi:TonB family protein
MNQILRVAFLLVSLPVLSTGRHSYLFATPRPSTVDPAIADLAGKLAESLKKVGAKHVIFLDFRGPQKESHLVGTWLRDQFSSALQNSESGLETIDGSKIRDRIEAEESSAGADLPWKRRMEIYRSAGADVVVSGSYARLSQRLGLTLVATSLNQYGAPPLPSIRGAVPISDEINGLSTEPIPTFKDNIFRAGIAGITSPTCIYCPSPEYSDKARKAGSEGTVLLDVTVTSEGRVERPIIISGPGEGLEAKALGAVKEWKLKPAEDIDNKPLPVRVQIEVTFHLYRSRH